MFSMFNNIPLSDKQVKDIAHDIAYSYKDNIDIMVKNSIGNISKHSHRISIQEMRENDSAYSEVIHSALAKKGQLEKMIEENTDYAIKRMEYTIEDIAKARIDDKINEVLLSDEFIRKFVAKVNEYQIAK